jgi:hypothetical protein
VQEGTVGGGLDRVSDVGILGDDHRVLAAELQHHPFEAASRLLREPPPGRCRPGEVDPLDQPAVEHGVGDDAGLPRCVRHHVEDAVRQPGLVQDLGPDRPAGVGRLLGRLEHHRVAQSEGPDDRPAAQGQGRVPGGDGADHTDRAAHRHRLCARQVGDEQLTDRPVGKLGGLAQQADREVDLDPAELRAAAGLQRQCIQNVVAMGRQDVGGPQQDSLPLRRRSL